MRILRGSLRGEAVAPPSKSYTHRALVIGALTSEKFEVIRPLLSEDTIATLSALSMMGTHIEKGNISVKMICPRLSSSKKVIDAKNSGTTLRLISGLAALLEGRCEITGDESLQRRPMKPLLNALRELGAKCTGVGDDEHPPVKIHGPMTGTHAKIPGNVSSQFISSLLIACPMKKNSTVIKIVGEQKSRSYIDISLHMLKTFRIEIQSGPDSFEMEGKQHPIGSRFEVPGDFSSAAFLLAGSAITGGSTVVKGLTPTLPQGDSVIVDALKKFGAEISINGDSVRCNGDNRLPFEFDVSNNPDLFPILGVMAAAAVGESRLFGGEHLKFKESNRISTTVDMLRDIGVDAEEKGDGCIVNGKGRIRGGNVHTQLDHRIMMAATIAGMASEQGVIIDDETSYSVSYPGFLDDIQRLGAIVQKVNS